MGVIETENEVGPFEVGDLVRIKCLGGYYGHYGVITECKSDGNTYRVKSAVANDNWEAIFAREHLELCQTNYEEPEILIGGPAAVHSLKKAGIDVGGGKKMSDIKDSGERTVFSTGSQRDMHEGKGDMLSVPWAAMLRVSKHYENGAKKYGRYNYLKGIPVSSFIDSALRHLAKYVAGYDDEDHLSAAAFNILGAIQMEEEKPEMCDLPWREGKRGFHYDENKSEGRISAQVQTDLPGEGAQKESIVCDNN